MTHDILTTLPAGSLAKWNIQPVSGRPVERTGRGSWAMLGHARGRPATTALARFPFVDIQGPSLPYAMTKTRGPGALDPQMRLHPALPVEELRQRLSAAFPEMFSSQSGLSILEIWHGGSRVRKAFAPRSAFAPEGRFRGRR